MSTTFAVSVAHRRAMINAAKFVLRRILVPFGMLAPFAFFFPKIAFVYAVLGVYDVTRNRELEVSTLRRYFIGNGFPAWFLSPLNTLLDLLSLPFINKGVYQLEDLPQAYQDEVKRVIQIAKEENLVAKLEDRSKPHRRTMFFFRWYGANVDAVLDIPGFHQPWQYIQTIGVSVFNKKVSTSKHFGFMRATLRVLYNLNDMKDDSAYIVVGDHINYWRKEKLFIFDDTLIHQSFNETDQSRYLLFVDIARPSPFPRVMTGVVAGARLLTQSFKFIYYMNWKMIER